MNNNTPVHIIQALLGHTSPDTVMIYAKPYPTRDTAVSNSCPILVPLASVAVFW
jgi:integrase